MNGMKARQASLERRRALTREQIDTLSEAVVARFFASCRPASGLWNGARVALYRPMPGEPRLDLVETRMRIQGALVYFPRRLGDELQLVHVPTTVAPQERWFRGSFGIDEPKPELVAGDPSQIDLVIVPGTAFGEKGQRVGMGAGYYDRLLPRCPKALRVALAFDFQIHDELDQEDWDQPMHWVMTETRDIEVDSKHVAPWRKESPKGVKR